MREDIINTERTGYPSGHKNNRLGTAIPLADYIKNITTIIQTIR